MKTLRLIFFLVIFCPVMYYAQIKVESVEKIIASQGEIYMNPKWSPDGKFISFSGANYKGLYLFDVSSKTIINLSQEDAAGFGSEWAPNSKAIVSRIAKYEGLKRLNAVKIFDTEKNESRQITEFRTFMPALPKWNKSGEKIYLPSKNNIEIFTSGEKPNSLQKNSLGEVFLNNNKIAVGNIDSGEFNYINPFKDQELLNLSISPDNSKIAFEVLGGNLYTMNTDGTQLHNLGKGFRASWSPDSRSLVYMISEDDGHQYTASDLFIINADGTGKQQITTTSEQFEMNPSWSPDGKKIVYDEMKQGAIYQVVISR